MLNYNPIRAAFEALREMAFGAITANYQLLGDELDQPARAIKLINNTNTVIYVSYQLDADTVAAPIDHDMFPAQSGSSWDFATNRIDPASILELPMRTKIYIKHNGVAPTSGSFAVVVLYASNK